MPTYDYKCENEECEHEWEDYHRMDHNETQCPECEQETAKRLIGRGSCIILKGSGFHAVDYKDPKKIMKDRADAENPLLLRNEGDGKGGVSDPDTATC